MSDRRYKLGTVQNHPSQFDGPLYKVLAADSEIDFVAHYTDSSAELVDPELGHRSGWEADTLLDYEHVIVPQGWWARVKWLRGLIRADYDLLIVSGYGTPLLLLLALLGRLGLLTLGLRSDTILQLTGKSQLKRVVKGVLAGCYVTGHPVGTLAAEYLLGIGFRKEALFRFPYAVNNDYFQAGTLEYSSQRNEIRGLYDISSEVIVVLAILKLIDREDPWTLVRGFAACAEPGMGLFLIVVGDGPLRPDIERFIEERRLRNVRLVGYRPYSELVQYYAIADMFVHPAQRESWGGSVGESMACGVPVIVSDGVGSHADLVVEGETGMVFPSGDADGLARCLRVLAYDADLRLSMAKACVTRNANWHYRETVHSLKMALARLAPTETCSGSFRALDKEL